MPYWCVSAKTFTDWGCGYDYLRADQTSVGHSAAHACNQGYASALIEANHLLGHCLGCHEDSSDVDAHHLVYVCRRILQSRSLLLYARRSNETVHPSVLVSDRPDDIVQLFHFSYIDSVIGQTCSECVLGTRSYSAEIFGRLRKSVDGMYFAVLLAYSPVF